MFESPLTPEKLESLLSSLRTGLEDLLGDQLEAVYLFGSHARGDAKPDSDIDVLIVLKDDFDYFEMIERTGELAADLSLKNETVIALAFVKKEDYEGRHTPFIMNVKREGIAV